MSHICGMGVRLALVVACISCSAYDGSGHQQLTEAAMRVLDLYVDGCASQKLNLIRDKDDVRVRELILQGCIEPDLKPGVGGDMSGLVNSLLGEWPISTIVQAVGGVDPAEFLLMSIASWTPGGTDALTQGLAGVSHTIVRPRNGSGLSFQRQTVGNVLSIVPNDGKPQTYVGVIKEETVSNRPQGEHVSNLGSKFQGLSKADEWAQQEYSLALAALSRDDLTTAYRQLGRTLHYLQDITVPHHTEVPGNCPDLINGFIAYLNSGKSIGPAGQVAIKAASSQARYEKGIADGCFVYVPTTGSLVYPGSPNRNMLTDDNEWRLIFEEMTKQADMSISQLMWECKDKIYNEGLIDYCDGLPSYKIDNYYSLIDKLQDIRRLILNQEYSAIEDIARRAIYPETVHYKLERVWVSGDREYTIGRNDSFSRVADEMVPLAIRNSALIILHMLHQRPYLCPKAPRGLTMIPDQGSHHARVE